MKKEFVITQPVLNLVLCITTAVIFFLSLLFSYKFLYYDYAPLDKDDSFIQPITVSIDKLIEGNSSGNMAQYMVSQDNSRFGYGTFCIKSDSIYYYKIERNRHYLIKSPVTSPNSGFPILEGFEIEYINIANRRLYFIGKQIDSPDPRKIYSIGLEGEDIAVADMDFSDDVTSLVTNSNYLYFTLDGRSAVYSMSLDGTNIHTMKTFTEPGCGIRLFGADKTHIYFVCDSYIGKIDFSTGKKEKITGECFSIYQSPMLTSNGIVYYSSLSNEDCMFVSKAGGTSAKLFNAGELKEIIGTDSDIRYINFSSGYIFIVCGNNVFYSAFGSSEITLLKGITLSDNGRVFFNDEYCIGETDDGIKSININWLLSQ